MGFDFTMPIDPVRYAEVCGAIAGLGGESRARVMARFRPGAKLRSGFGGFLLGCAYGLEGCHEPGRAQRVQWLKRLALTYT